MRIKYNNVFKCLPHGRLRRGERQIIIIHSIIDASNEEVTRLLLDLVEEVASSTIYRERSYKGFIKIDE